jgi:hypothetical protein
MSSTAGIIAVAVLDLAVIAALAAVCLTPFRLGRRQSSAIVVELPHDRLEPSRWAA